MAKGFFKERKHYTLQNIADILYEKENVDLEETRRLVGILKKYGVVKAVKRTKPEFADLSNEDIVLTDPVTLSMCLIMLVLLCLKGMYSNAIQNILKLKMNHLRN